MSEPPKLPSLERPNEPPSDNPFAPTTSGILYRKRVGKISLNVWYWISLVTLLGILITLSVFGIVVGWAGVFMVSAAAIRVPLLQRRHCQEDSGPILANAFVLFFTSLAMMLVFGVVSFIAFAAVCIPSSIAVLRDENYSVALISAVVGLMCFFLQFWFSLRLRF